MVQGVHFSRTRAIVLAGAAGIFLALGLGAVAAQNAPAQGPGSDFCDEYPDVPGCETGPTGTTGTTGPNGTDGPNLAEGPAATEAGDELPFTGYPLTALILLLLILLLVGLTIRAYLAIRDRVTGDRHAGP